MVMEYWVPSLGIAIEEMWETIVSMKNKLEELATRNEDRFLSQF